MTVEEELAPLEEHIPACPSCAEQAEAVQDHVTVEEAGLLMAAQVSDGMRKACGGDKEVGTATTGNSR